MNTQLRAVVQVGIEFILNAACLSLARDRAHKLHGFRQTMQLDRYSCGACVLRSTIGWFGRPVSAVRLNRMYGTKRGTSPDGIVAELRRNQLGATQFHGTLGDIRRKINRGFPVIVELDDDTRPHWGVVFGYARGKILLMDPSPRTMGQAVKTSVFQQRWNGWGICVFE